VNTGTHTVGETAGTSTSLSNYTSSISCTNGASSTNSGPLNVNVTTGSSVTCTITNTRNTGKLTVVKDLSPAADPGLFNLQIDGSTPASGANVGDGGTTGAQTVTPGVHTVGETAGTGTSLANYTSSISCDDDAATSSTDSGPLNVTVNSNDDITCTITNTRNTGKLTVVKDLSPAADPGLFNLQIDGSTPASGANVGDGGTTGAQTVTPGVHTVGETAGTGTSLANYTSSISCDDDAATSSTDSGPLNVTVNSNDDITCTITNTRNTGKLTVVKDLSPAADPGLFNLQIDGSTPASGANVGDGGTTGAQTVTPGVHTVGETAGTGTSLANYTSSISCDDDAATSSTDSGPLNVTVNSNDDITCTITNTRNGGKLTVVKDLSPAADPGLFNLQIDGSTPASGANVGDGGTTGAQTVTPGVHTVGETAGTGTSLANYTSSI